MNQLVEGTTMSFLTAVMGVGLALLVFFAVMRLFGRRRKVATDRKARRHGPRLAVLDSVAVDTRRRLVLIRRDETEHLVMIGGPTDLVIESRIGLSQEVTDRTVAERPGVSAQTTARTASRTDLETGAPATEKRPVAADSPDARDPLYRSQPTVAPAQFEPERFDTDASHERSRPAPPSGQNAANAKASAGGIPGGVNPFDESDFTAILDAEMSRRPPTTVASTMEPKAPRQTDGMTRSPSELESVPSVDSPDMRQPDRRNGGSLEEEMAKLLGEIGQTRDRDRN